MQRRRVNLRERREMDRGKRVRERLREMESASELDDPVTYWQWRSRQALESQGVKLPPPRLLRRPTREPLRCQPYPLPRRVENVRHRHERVGLDLICNNCQHHVLRSQVFTILCHFYSPIGPRGYPLTRCYLNCPNCKDEWELGRSVGDADKFVAFAGATQHFLAEEKVAESSNSIENDAYPDAILDSPNDFRSYLTG